MTPSIAAAVAAVVGWAAAVILLGQSGAPLALPALAGWSVSAVIGIDAAWRHERMPWILAGALVAAAALFAGIALFAV